MREEGGTDKQRRERKVVELELTTFSELSVT